MKQKNFTLSSHLGKSWSGYLSKLVALMLLVGGLGAAQTAVGQGFLGTGISITAQTNTKSSSTQYTGGDATTAVNTSTLTFFNGADLGNGSTFNIANGSLVATMASDTLNGITYDGKKFVTYPFVNSTLYYRIYLDGTTGTPYTAVPLSLTSSSTTSSPVTYAINGSLDLLTLARATGGGTYRMDIYFEAKYQKPNTANPTTVNDPGSGVGNPASATFKVDAPAVTPSGSTTRWISTSANGATASDWFTASNWSNGVPNGYSDAVIPEATDGSTIVFPVLSDLTKNYRIRNLTLEGTTASGKAQLTINTAVLRVYGDITQEASGLVGTNSNNVNVADTTKNSTLILAGGNQVISTGRLVIPDVIVAGSGYKYVLGNLVPFNSLSFRPSNTTNGVILMTASRKVNSSGTVYYGLNTTGTPTVNLTGPGLQNGIINATPGSNETTSSFVEGYLTTGGALTANSSQTFGNIGLDLFSNHNAANVTVIRIIGDPLKGPTNSSGATPKPIQRQYQIVGDDDSTTGSSSSSTVTFHYLPSSFELNGIKQANLALFRTTSGNAPYTSLGGIVDTVNYTVTQSNLPAFKNYYYTLGDKTNPLPVSLVAFNAVRSGANTLLSWTTASEENNKGFNVQVSADGVAYRTLAFVASQSPNSSNTLAYKYTDTEAGKAGTRYYRLEQVDMDGKVNYSPVRAVGFDGAAATAVALVAYPNPFGDTIGLTVEGATVTEGAASVKLIDMTGRTVIDQKLSLNGASLTLGDLSSLRSGLYLAKVTLPDGSVQTVRVQKQ